MNFQPQKGERMRKSCKGRQAHFCESCASLRLRFRQSAELTQVVLICQAYTFFERYRRLPAHLFQAADIEELFGCAVRFCQVPPDGTFKADYRSYSYGQLTHAQVFSAS